MHAAGEPIAVKVTAARLGVYWIKVRYVLERLVRQRALSRIKIRAAWHIERRAIIQAHFVCSSDAKHFPVRLEDIYAEHAAKTEEYMKFHAQSPPLR